MKKLNLVWQTCLERSVPLSQLHLYRLNRSTAEGFPIKTSIHACSFISGNKDRLIVCVSLATFPRLFWVRCGYVKYCSFSPHTLNRGPSDSANLSFCPIPHPPPFHFYILLMLSNCLTEDGRHGNCLFIIYHELEIQWDIMQRV